MKRKMVVSLKDLEEKVYSLEKDNYTIIRYDKMWRVKTLFKHNVCGNTFEMEAGRFVKNNGNRCPHCAVKRVSKKRSLGKEKFLEKFYKVLDEDYQIKNLDEYKNVKSNLIIYHKKCNSEYSVLARHVLYDHNTCPICNKREHSSRGEKKIIKFLEDNNINFEFEYKEEKIQIKINSKSNITRGITFDFCIFKDGKKYFIEFDGNQHFRPYNNRKDNKSLIAFKRLKELDKVRDDFCKENNIPFLRIPYWKENKIEELIKDFIKI